MITPLQAAVHRDISELRRLLEGGWTPDPINQRFSGPAPNDSLWSAVVLADWAEGLALLDKFFPKNTRRMDLWNIALRNASNNCVALLWDLMKLEDVLKKTPSLAGDWTQGVMASLGDPWSPPHEFRDAFGLGKILKSKNVDLSFVYPGYFEYSDLRMSGHSLWTRSIMLKRWDCVDLFWPEQDFFAGHPEKYPQAWPRILEVVEHALDVVIGDYKPLVSESLLFDQQDPSFDFSNQTTADTPQVSIFAQGEKEFLLRWMKDFGADWMMSNLPECAILAHPQEFEQGSQMPVFEWLARPAPTKISPWLRLPLVLNANERQIVWDVWASVLEQDPRRQWLSALAFYPEDEDVLGLLKLAAQDRPKAFTSYWSAPIDQGLAHLVLPPSEIWANMDGNIDISKSLV